MVEPNKFIQKNHLINAVQWWQGHFRQTLVNPIESQFPNFPLPAAIQAVLQRTGDILRDMQGWPDATMLVSQVREQLLAGDPNRLPLFQQIVCRYRRSRAAYIESLTEKTIHAELTETLEQEVKALDALAGEDWFQKINVLRLPRLKDYQPVQYIESAALNLFQLPPRQHDEKFHILQAPNLFLPDLAYFRAKCEDRETPLAIAFLDIDHFKQFNTAHTETKVDRNLLPRFMQTVEAHVFHHGFGYRQGGDEYLILVPSMSRALAVVFFDELRSKLAGLNYPDIDGKTTVSMGLCVVESDCPLTDRELRDRASQAKQFAKNQGRNCIASYEGHRFVAEELKVVSPKPS